MWILLADNGGTPGGVVAALIAGFVSLMTLMAWVMRTLLSDTIPTLTRTYTAEAQADRELYREQVREEREACDKRANDLLKEWQRSHAETLAGLGAQARERQEAMGLLRSMQQSLNQGVRLSEIVRQADDAIWSKTIDGVITSWNRAAHHLLGWHPGEVIGQSVYRLVPPDLHEEERAMLEQLRRGERVNHYQTERFHRDGRRVRLDVSISPVRDASGQVISVGTIARELP
jgi:PAS domain S-box-containing protein